MEFNNQDYVSRTAGTIPITDVAIVGSGKIAIATGEAGIRIYDPKNDSFSYMDTPAHKLVPSRTGTTFLAISDRGEFRKVSVVNLRNRSSREWGLSKIGLWSDDYDGSLWFMADEARLHAMDTHAVTFRSLWSMDERVVAIQRTDTWLYCVIVQTPSTPTRSEQVSLSLFRYQLPDLILRNRQSFEIIQDQIIQNIFIAPDGTILMDTYTQSEETSAGEEPDEIQLTIIGSSFHGLNTILRNEKFVSIHSISFHKIGYVILSGLRKHLTKEGVQFSSIVLIVNPDGTVAKRILLEKAENSMDVGAVSLRCSGNTLVTGTEDGRLLLYDFVSGEVRFVRLH